MSTIYMKFTRTVLTVLGAVTILFAIAPVAVFADNVAVAPTYAQEYKAAESSLSPLTKLVRVIFTPRYFEQHKIHFYDDPGLLWFMVAGNALIALSYTLIPIALVYLVRKRKDIMFTPIFFLFAAFIVLCGVTHVMHIMIFWYPAYWLEGVVLALTGIISIFTFFALLYVLPLALKLKTPKEMEELNSELSKEIEHSKQVEKNLKQNEKIVLGENEDLQKTIVELATQTKALEKINKIMVDRELKMAELKEENRRLKEKT